MSTEDDDRYRAPIELTVCDPSPGAGWDENILSIVARNPVTKVAAWIPVTREVVQESAEMRALIEERFDRMLHPWRYPDPVRGWWIDPFPRWTRLCALVRRARMAVT